jgi:hypothetical protein
MTREQEAQEALGRHVFPHWELPVIHSCIFHQADQTKKIVDMMVEIVESNTTVSICSSDDAMFVHPVFNALVKMGTIALPRLFERLKLGSSSWTELAAIQSILTNLPMDGYAPFLSMLRPEIPAEHHGMIRELEKDYIKWWADGADGHRCMKCNCLFKKDPCPMCTANKWPKKKEKEE